MKTIEKIDNLLCEAQEPIFDTNTADQLVTKLEKGIKVPFLRVQKSTLGGKDKPSVLVTISLDPKESWANGIFENSRYMRFHVTLPNVIEQFNRSKIKTKFRKAKAKNLDEVVKKITQYVEKVKKEVKESLDEGRDFSNAHYALVKRKMYGDTQSIYILDELGGRIRHLGFGDFGTGNPIKLPGVGDVKVEYVRADGTPVGKSLKKAGFSGRPHYVDFPGIDNPEKAAKALAKIYGQKGAVEVKI